MLIMYFLSGRIHKAGSLHNSIAILIGINKKGGIQKDQRGILKYL